VGPSCIECQPFAQERDKILQLFSQLDVAQGRGRGASCSDIAGDDFYDDGSSHHSSDSHLQLPTTSASGSDGHVTRSSDLAMHLNADAPAFASSSANSSPSRFANRTPVRFRKSPLPKAAVNGLCSDRADTFTLPSSPAAAAVAATAAAAAAAVSAAPSPSPSAAAADLKIHLPPPLPLPPALKELYVDPATYEIQLANKLLEDHGLQALIELVGRVTESSISSSSSSSHAGRGNGNIAGRSSLPATGGVKHSSIASTQQTHQHSNHSHSQQHTSTSPLTYSDFAACGGLLKDAVMSAAVQALPVCMIDTFAIKQMKEMRAHTMSAAAKYDAKQQKYHNLRKPGPMALEVTLNQSQYPNTWAQIPNVLILQLSAFFERLLQVSACDLQKEDDDIAGSSAFGDVVPMLKDYSDFFDAMKAAASVTEDNVMQYFVAWYGVSSVSSITIWFIRRRVIRYTKASLAWSSTKSSSIETLLKTQALSCVNLENFGITSGTCCALAEVLILLPSSCISTLNLSVNSLQDLGAAAIAFVADRRTALTSLNLNSAKIGPPGAAAIASAMKASRCGGGDLPTRAALGQMHPSSTRVPLAQVFKNGKVTPGCAACDAPHVEQLQLQLLQQGQGRHHASSGATGLVFLEQRYACLFDRSGTGFKMQVKGDKGLVMHWACASVCNRCSSSCAACKYVHFACGNIHLYQGGWSVTDLDLSHNILYAAGGLAVFEALKSNPLQSLRRLKLVSCKLSSAQLGVCIGKVLGAGEGMCLLKELDIGWNDFDDSSMQVNRALAIPLKTFSFVMFDDTSCFAEHLRRRYSQLPIGDPQCRMECDARQQSVPNRVSRSKI
jgi:hypothetical protein